MSVPNAGQSPGYFAQRPDTRPIALWVGDSYAAGTGAGNSSVGEAALTVTSMDWKLALDAEGGTGFNADGHTNDLGYAPLIGRLKSDRASTPNPAVVVIDAGRNDKGPTLATRAAVSVYFAAIARAYPNARVVVIEPYWINPRAQGTLKTLRAYLTQQASARHWTSIDPQNEGWINNSTRRFASSSAIGHPNAAGHRYIAAHLEADLKRLNVVRS